MQRVEVLVAGAGIAGLACAAELMRLGVEDIAVLEAGPRPGGAIESRRSGPFLIERGPTTVRSTPDLEDLVSAHGISLLHGVRLPPSVVHRGRVVPLPPRPLDLLRGRPLPLHLWPSLLAEPLRRTPPGPRSVERFVRERFGRGIAERFADLMTLGIYGAPARQIGFEAAFSQLASDLDQHGSLARLLWFRSRHGAGPRAPLISTERGLGAIPQALAEILGERLYTGHELTGVTSRPEGFELRSSALMTVRTRHLVLALPPSSVRGLFPHAPDVTRVAARFRSSPCVVAQLAIEDPELCERFRSFGFLVPPRESLPLMGAIATSQLFPGRAPAGSMLLSVFADPALIDESDSQLHARLGPVVTRLLGTQGKAELIDVCRHPGGIWLYDRRQPMRASVLRSRLREQGIEIAGWAYDGISVGAAALSGIQAARRITGSSQRR